MRYDGGIPMNEQARANPGMSAFMVGAMLGAGVALLLAPANGRDTRKKLATTARRLGEGVNGKFGHIKDTIANHASNLQGDVKEAIDVGRAAASKR